MTASPAVVRQLKAIFRLQHLWVTIIREGSSLLQDDGMLGSNGVHRFLSSTHDLRQHSHQIHG